MNYKIKLSNTVFSADYTQVFFAVYCQEINIIESMQPRKISKDKKTKR